MQFCFKYNQLILMIFNRESRVLKYPKTCLEDLTIFFMSTWWGDSKNIKEIEFSRWHLSYLQNNTANSAHLTAHFNPALVCPQKATVKIQFLPFFGITSSSRHEKCCQIFQTLFWEFQYSIIFVQASRMYQNWYLRSSIVWQEMALLIIFTRWWSTNLVTWKTLLKG